MRAVNGFDKLFKRIVKGEISLSWRGSGPKVTWRDCEQSRFGKSLGRPVSYGFLRIKTEKKEEKKKKWKRAMEMEIERMKSFRVKRNVSKPTRVSNSFYACGK